MKSAWPLLSLTHRWQWDVLYVVEVCWHHGENGIKSPIVDDQWCHHRINGDRSKDWLPRWTWQRRAFILGRQAALDVMFFLLRMNTVIVKSELSSNWNAYICDSRMFCRGVKYKYDPESKPSNCCCPIDVEDRIPADVFSQNSTERKRKYRSELHT